MEIKKLMHSLNTTDSIAKKNDEDLFMHACYFFLSCVYAKMNGFYIELHTDELGKELLRNAPYDNIIVDIERPEWMSDHFFAWPKFIALENSDRDVIHIDGDVMLRNMHIRNLLWEKCDVVCQCEENRLLNPYYGRANDVSAEVLKHCDYPEWAERKCDIMYNTGVIGVFNRDLRRDWINAYWNMTKEFNEKEDRELFLPHSYPDIIIEQQFLRDLVVYGNYSCNFIIDEKSDFDKMNQEAVDKGYFHVMNDKRRMLQRCVNRILEINPEFEMELLRMRSILGLLNNIREKEGLS